ncbi:hypothetical protein MSP8887_03039 [Marinomonas spartinae]|nr:hypothetical protein MSP8887_03039 [Marinomonas spartinae]
MGLKNNDYLVCLLTCFDSCLINNKKRGTWPRFLTALQLAKRELRCEVCASEVPISQCPETF